jgi:hypothetical protein
MQKNKTIVGYFDDVTRLVAAERFFIIERYKKSKDKWQRFHYYSDLGDVFRAYARMLLHQDDPSIRNQSRTIVQILDRILILEKKIDDAAKRLQVDWAKLLTDPIERVILKGQNDDRSC